MVRLRRGLVRRRTAATPRAATWIFCGDEAPRRRGRDVDIPWRRIAATPRAATWTFCGDEAPRRRGRDVGISVEAGARHRYLSPQTCPNAAFSAAPAAHYFAIITPYFMVPVYLLFFVVFFVKRFLFPKKKRA